jgi:prepilin-type N-terminal cleavage/methylation domain-containing protein
MKRDANTTMMSNRVLRNKREAAFTLLELIVTLTLAAILGRVAAFEFPALMQSYNRMDARAQLVQDIKRAQAESITWGCRGIFKVDSDRRGYTFGCDFLDYDTNIPPTADKIFLERDLPDRIYLSVSGPVIFNSRGQAVDPYGDINNVELTLYESGRELPVAQGVLLGTGVFGYDE